MSEWHIHFCTSWDDEPPDTVINVTWQAGVDVIEAATESEALKKFQHQVDSWRRRFYEDEGSLWAVPV